MNTFEWCYDYISYKIVPVVLEERFFKFRECTFANVSQCKKMWPFHLNKLKYSLPRNAFCQVWIKQAQWFWRRRFLKFMNVCSLFHNYLPFKNGEALRLKKMNPLHPRMHCAKFAWNWLSGFVEDFWNLLMYFCNFVIISFWKSVDTFMLINLNSLHPKITCWNLPSGSWEEVFLKFMTECLLFHNYLPLEKVLACHLNKLEPPPPKNALCHVWSKLAQWFWRIRFLNLLMYSSYFVSISPLKRTGPNFN